jgi:hypothetical protein
MSLISLTAQTLTGLSTIRAFNLTGQFSTDNEYRLNRNNELYYMLQCGNTWLSMRLEWIAAGVVGLNALSCFLAIYFNLGFFTIALASFAISTVSSLGTSQRLTPRLCICPSVEECHRFGDSNELHRAPPGIHQVAAGRQATRQGRQTEELAVRGHH